MKRDQVLQTAQMLLNVALCNLVERNVDLEEGRGRFIRMFGTYLPDYTALDPRRLIACYYHSYCILWSNGGVSIYDCMAYSRRCCYYYYYYYYYYLFILNFKFLLAH